MTTTEATSKMLKKHSLLSAGLLCMGFVFVMASESGAASYTAGLFMAIGGFVWFLVTRARTWWHHG